MKNRSALAFIVISVFIISGWPSHFADRSYAGADTRSPTVFVNQPRGGEVLTAGSTFTIAWTSRDNVGVTRQDVLFSANGGSSYTAIVSSLPGSARSYDWTVPNTPTATGKVRVVA